MTYAEALQEPPAHAITRTLGGPPTDSGADEPSIVEFEIGRDLAVPGRLMLCTDGFWDCDSDPERFVSLVMQWIRQHPANAGAAALAASLVNNACEHRGHDNITVAMLDVGY
jgi:serine/threonine protein phosphatase PrpC